MQLKDLINRPSLRLGAGKSLKIPWHDPAFSTRMLECHLSQEDDWASRRASVIDRQVSGIVKLLPEPPARILDLACGPGLYTSRLSVLGHECLGVDFSPASIAYAKEQADRQAAKQKPGYILGDIRQYRPEGRFDAVLFLFGEINAFTRAEAAAILRTACGALRPGGKLLVEVHAREEIKRQGLMAPQWRSYEYGLFSAAPHLCLEEHAWDEATGTALTRYYIVDTNTGQCREYSAALCAYSEAEYRELFAGCGFNNIRKMSREHWPVGGTFQDKLHAYVCRRPGRARKSQAGEA